MSPATRVCDTIDTSKSRGMAGIVGQMTAKLDKVLLTGREVSQVLNISRSRAYRWMAIGILPTVRIRGCHFVRVPKDGLMRWIQKNTVRQSPKATSHRRRHL